MPAWISAVLQWLLSLVPSLPWAQIAQFVTGAVQALVQDVINLITSSAAARAATPTGSAAATASQP